MYEARVLVGSRFALGGQNQASGSCICCSFSTESAEPYCVCLLFIALPLFRGGTFVRGVYRKRSGSSGRFQRATVRLNEWTARRVLPQEERIGSDRSKE